MSNLVHNERMKLVATFLNNLGVAAIAGGAIIPALTGAGHPPVGIVLPFSFVMAGLVLGLVLHFIAQHALSKMRE